MLLAALLVGMFVGAIFERTFTVYFHVDRLWATLVGRWFGLFEKRTHFGNAG